MTSPPSRGARIETNLYCVLSYKSGSPPSRGARIETHVNRDWSIHTAVAPFTGGAD